MVPPQKTGSNHLKVSIANKQPREDARLRGGSLKEPCDFCLRLSCATSMRHDFTVDRVVWIRPTTIVRHIRVVVRENCAPRDGRKSWRMLVAHEGNQKKEQKNKGCMVLEGTRDTEQRIDKPCACLWVPRPSCLQPIVGWIYLHHTRIAAAKKKK